MLCPFCLNDTPPAAPICVFAQCNEPLPPAYLDIHRGRKAPPLVILSVVGFRGHGKTVYLASLFDLLDHAAPTIWSRSKFSALALDQNTITALQRNRGLLRQGELPNPTLLTFPKPSIHQLLSIPQIGDRTLLIYDPSGESFEDDEGVGKFAHFVKRSNCVMFLISMADLLADSVADEMFRLLNTYILGMSRMGAKTKAQHLIIVFTKADQLIHKFAPSVQNYLRQEGLSAVADLSQYLKELQNISDLLYKFTIEELGAQKFITQAEKSFRDVCFTAVSALGSQPRSGSLEVEPSPKRVIDPLLWVLSKPAAVLAFPPPLTAATYLGLGETNGQQKPTTAIKSKPESAARSKGGVIFMATLVLLFCLGLAGWYVLKTRSVASVVIVNTQNLNLRRSPGATQKTVDDVILVLPKDTKVMLLGEAQVIIGTRWVKVRVENQECWAGSDLQTKQLIVKQEGWVNEAMLTR